MAGTAAEVEESLTNALSLLVNLGKVILQNAKQEAGGKNWSDIWTAHLDNSIIIYEQSMLCVWLLWVEKHMYAIYLYL